jgi:hypothetical protein
MIQKLRGFFSNRKKAAATGAVVFGLLGTSVGGGITILAPASEDPPLVADYYMATSGSDSNLGTQGSPFLTMDKCADQAQSSAKTCEMASGTYSAQTLNISAGTRSGLMTFRPAAAGSVTINGISNGTNGGSNDKAQSFIKIDGDVGTLTINGSFTCWWNNGAVANDIYLNEITVTDTSSAGDLVSCGDTNNFSITNSTLGPSCCRGVGMGMGKAAVGSPGNTNHLYQDLTIYGLWDTCLGVGGADAWPTEYGSCSGTGFGDWQACGGTDPPCGQEPRHIDGIQIVDCDTCTVDRVTIFRLLGASSQGLFVHANQDGAFSNITVKNVMIAGTRQGSFVFDGDGGTLSGTFKLLYTTSAGAGAGFLFGTTVGNRVFAAGTSIIAVGNVGPMGTSENDCVLTAYGGSTITPTAWANLNSARTCFSDENGSATFVSTVHPFDLRLQSGSNGVNEGETVYCGSGKDVDRDLEGTTRFLGSACDRGADEKE